MAYKRVGALVIVAFAFITALRTRRVDQQADAVIVQGAPEIGRPGSSWWNGWAMALGTLVLAAVGAAGTLLALNPAQVTQASFAPVWYHCTTSDNSVSRAASRNQGVGFGLTIVNNGRLPETVVSAGVTRNHDNEIEIGTGWVLDPAVDTPEALSAPRSVTENPQPSRALFLEPGQVAYVVYSHELLPEQLLTKKQWEELGITPAIQLGNGKVVHLDVNSPSVNTGVTPSVVDQGISYFHCPSGSWGRRIGTNH
jgi:hypothetical protein